jgi:hypothetical protein
MLPRTPSQTLSGRGDCFWYVLVPPSTFNSFHQLLLYRATAEVLASHANTAWEEPPDASAWEKVTSTTPLVAPTALTLAKALAPFHNVEVSFVEFSLKSSLLSLVEVESWKAFILHLLCFVFTSMSLRVDDAFLERFAIAARNIQKDKMYVGAVIKELLSDQYEDAGQFLEDLVRKLEKRPISSRPARNVRGAGRATRAQRAEFFSVKFLNACKLLMRDPDRYVCVQSKLASQSSVNEALQLGNWDMLANAYMDAVHAENYGNTIIFESLYLRAHILYHAWALGGDLHNNICEALAFQYGHPISEDMSRRGRALYAYLLMPWPRLRHLAQLGITWTQLGDHAKYIEDTFEKNPEMNEFFAQPSLAMKVGDICIDGTFPQAPGAYDNDLPNPGEMDWENDYQLVDEQGEAIRSNPASKAGSNAGSTLVSPDPDFQKAKRQIARENALAQQTSVSLEKHMAGLKIAPPASASASASAPANVPPKIPRVPASASAGPANVPAKIPKVHLKMPQQRQAHVQVPKVPKVVQGTSDDEELRELGVQLN